MGLNLSSKIASLAFFGAAFALCTGAGCKTEETVAPTAFLRISMIAGATPVGGVRLDVASVSAPDAVNTYCFRTTRDESPFEPGETALSFALSREDKGNLADPITLTLTTFDSLAGSGSLIPCPEDFSALTPLSPPRTVTTSFCGDGAGPREIMFHLAPTCTCQGSGGSAGAAGSAGTAGAAGQSGGSGGSAGAGGAGAGGAAAGAGGAAAGAGGAAAGAGGAAGNGGASGVGGGSADIATGNCCEAGQACGAGITSDPSSTCKPDQCCIAEIGDVCTQPVVQ